MATKAVAGEVARVAPFRMGSKQVYLPDHVITFLRPKTNQSPTIATFMVPLTFNKLDFRDYLWNVYGVGVTSLRSFVNQMGPRQRSLTGAGAGGKWYRPQSQKMMVVDLVKPFVWPKAPAKEDMTPWDKRLFTALEDAHKADMEDSQRSATGTPKLRVDKNYGPNRAHLRKQAEELLKGKRKWTPTAPLEETWIEVEEDVEKSTNAKGGDSGKYPS